MPDFLILMHNDAPDGAAEGDWPSYIGKLIEAGRFQGGSAIGTGACIRKSGETPAIAAHLSDFIRISADDLDHARALMQGNPAYEAGATVEIRLLPRTD